MNVLIAPALGIVGLIAAFTVGFISLIYIQSISKFFT